MYKKEFIKANIAGAKKQLLSGGYVDSFYSGGLLNIAEEYLITMEPSNKVDTTAKKPTCPYCRENFITHDTHDFCGSCGMAFNR